MKAKADAMLPPIESPSKSESPKKNLGRSARSPVASRDSTTEKNKRSASENSSTSRNTRGASKLCLLGTSLDDDQKKKLTDFEKKFDAKVFKEFDTKVTHIIGSIDPTLKTKTTVRTLKYMKGLLTHKWLVSFQWIEESLKKDKVLDEEEFELDGTKKQLELGAPKISRQSKKMIFNDVSVFFDGKFQGKDGVPNKNELISLIELGGGKVINKLPSNKRLSEPESKIMIILEDPKKKRPLKCKQIDTKEMFGDINNFVSPVFDVL